LAGLNQGQEIEDELRSSLPSSALDALRDAIVSYMPDAEEIVSRAMLNALFDVAVSMTRPHVLNESYAANPFQIEAEMLKETLDWIDNHRFCSDLDDMKYVIMQKHVDAAFEHVHNDRLTVAEALRALLSVACLLKLNLSNPVVNNTVVIVDLATNTTTKDVIDALATFGEIENTAFVQETGFGKVLLCCEPCFVRNGHADILFGFRRGLSVSFGCFGRESLCGGPRKAVANRRHLAANFASKHVQRGRAR
jgi:hypothetical protein